MEAQKRIDKVLAAAQKKVESEVGVLLGVPFVLSGTLYQPVSKKDFFDNLSGRQIVAKIDVTGEIVGDGCLVVSIKDAIRLGGTLIMLPPSELEDVIARDGYNEDTEDSFGEIANIIAGSYTKVFEEMYPQNCRFIRKEQIDLLPIKVVVDSAEPVPNQIYYQISTTMTLGDKQIGDMYMLLPAASFGLVWEEAATAPIEEAKGWPEKQPAIQEAPPQPPEHAEVAVPQEIEIAMPEEPPFDLEKHQKRLDRLLKDCQEKMEEEVGALLGCEIKLQDQKNRLISKEEFFFEEVAGKQVVANMDIVGELEGTSYLFVGLKDAIYIGGTLIMLPQSELDSVVGEESFGDDTQDAYGEIANIIAGVYSAIFEEQYIKKIRFVKTSLDQIVPMKVNVDSDSPVPNQQYYMSSMSLILAGKKLGKVRVLFSSRMLQLDMVARIETPAPVKMEVKKPPVLAARKEGVEFDILIISDDDNESEKLAGVLAESGYNARILSYKDSVQNSITKELRAVYLVMREVNEQAFGMAIKVSSTCSVPLIAAGPAWTKSKVFKAVKYGVRDILLTPASREDIEENVAKNLIKLAA
ncbi:MAG: hypothetical protein Q8R88_11480 [Desulfoprunum sp.]|nr:hypothetical protein [Desulfoprunum sp.]